LQLAGLRVPQDCSVAGFDNILFSAYTNPPLTTLDQPKRHIGAQAATLLLDLLDGGPAASPCGEHQTRVLRGNLLVRASTAPPPAEG
jgi:DNA-binding LacI/PurR family transcriptional regulator